MDGRLVVDSPPGGPTQITVELPKHVASIFGKLGLPPSDGDNRRVLAVLRYLGG